MKIFYVLLFCIFLHNAHSQVTADFKASKTVAFINDQILFENLSEGDSLEYKWDFGDISVSFRESPVHSYNVKGTFDITLIAYNSEYADTMVKKDYINIHSILKADFDYDIKGATGGYSVNCINLSEGDVIGYKWNFYNGIISTDQNPTGIYDTPGQYNISLKVSDGYFTDSLFLYDVVEINHPPINIEKYNREHIYYDIGSNKSLGAVAITNGYLIGTDGNKFQQILKFNHNKKLSWKKQYDNKFFTSIAYDVDDFDKTWVALNSDVYHTTIEVIDYTGEIDFTISDPFKINQNGQYDILDLKKVSTGIAVIANFGKEAKLNIYNIQGDLIFESDITDDDCLIDDFNIDFLEINESHNDDIYVFQRKLLSDTEEYRYFYTQFVKTEESYECANIVNGLCACTEIPEIIFEPNADFIIYNDNDMLYIQERKVYNVRNFKSSEPEFFNYSNLVHTEIYGIELIGDDKFAVAGKFNGHMKLSVVDLNYDIVEDFLSNRLGFFKSVYNDGKGNLILSGTIKKNYEEYALYYLNIPFDQLMSVGDEKYTSPVYPNPAREYINIKTNEINAQIMIYDIMGIKIGEYSNTDKIDVSHLANGLYFVKVNDSIFKFIKL